MSTLKAIKLLISAMLLNQVWAQQSVNCNGCAGGNTNGGYSDGCHYDYFSGNHIPPRNNSPWVEIFSESFSTNYIDQGDYVQYDNGWNASYHYTGHATDLSCNKRANLSTDVANGWVHLHTKYEPNTLCNTDDGDTYVDYTMVSLFPWDISSGGNMRFGPGKFEMRCWLPYVSGQWPAFWLYEDDPDESPHKQEIDIFEIKQDPVDDDCLSSCDYSYYTSAFNAATRMIMTTHYSEDNSDTACAPQNCYLSASPLSSGWHTFTLIWDEDIIEWFVDGSRVYYQERFTYYTYENLTTKNRTFPSAKIDMWLNIGSSIWTLNQAANVGDCGLPLTPNDWLIDYVKVWERQCGTGARTLCFDVDPFYFFDQNDAIIKAQTIETSASCNTWQVDAGQKLRLGATDEIKLVNFEARLGSEFIATIESCNDLEYREMDRNNPEIIASEHQSKSNANKSSILIYPNPSNGEFNISVKSLVSRTTNLSLLDLSGRIIHSQLVSLTEGSTQITISKSELPSGIYFVKLNGFDEIQKIIVAN
jgi:hypothetical protein